MPRPSSYVRGSLEERFWAKVQIGRPDECWLWTAGCFRKGYGQFRTDATHKRSAHRVAWELTNGPIPAGLFACHTCDVGLCVNPSHLFLGTNEDNMRDCRAKGRAYVPPPPFGETHPCAKLTESQAREILRRYAEATKKLGLQSALAREFGVNHRTVNLLVNGQKWKHLQVSPRPNDRARPCDCN